MSRIVSTAKLVLFAAIFGAMIFVGCNNSSSDDEPNGGGNTTVPDDSGTGGGENTGGNGDAMPSTITIGEYTAKVEASEGVTYSNGKFVLPKSPEDRATLSLIFEDAADASGGFRFDYSRNEAGENEGYSAGVEFFDIVADDNSEPFAASWGIGYWTHSESTTYKSVTIITDNGDYKPSNEIKEKYANGMKKLKTVKLTASPYFDWTVSDFKITGSNNEDIGTKIELPGVSFSDPTAKDMVSKSDDWTNFAVEDGYLAINAGGWANFTITYPSPQDLTNKKIKITGYLGSNWKKSEGGDVSFNVADGDDNEYCYSAGSFTLTTDESSITSEYGWDNDKKTDMVSIVSVKIYPKDNTGTLYIKSIEFVD